ncbi:MAG: hypothetical protein IPP47_31220 [Bryobacterales bacterium]|nr:hypothetical protein [Bryobacterales bacterium]
MMPRLLPSQYKIQVVTASPERYSLDVDGHRYQISKEGNVEFKLPLMSGGCRTYLFDHIPLSVYHDPAKQKVVSVVRNDKMVRRLSFLELQALPLGNSGTRLLVVRAND